MLNNKSSFLRVTKINKMNELFFVVPILIPVFSGVLIVIISWLFIRRDIQKYLTHKSSENGKFPETAGKGYWESEREALMHSRLDAHERLIVFVDRLDPANLFLRVYKTGISAREFQEDVLVQIRNEYQHNVAQQLYISSENWRALTKLKDDTTVMINNVAAALPEEATGVDLSRRILEHMAGIKDNPYVLMLELLKKDIHKLF